MTATATMTHRLTMPKKMSVFLAKKAKQKNTTLSQAFIQIMEDAMEYAEEGHIWELALERDKTCTGDLVPMSEIWTPEQGLRNPL